MTDGTIHLAHACNSNGCDPSNKCTLAPNLHRIYTGTAFVAGNGDAEGRTSVAVPTCLGQGTKTPLNFTLQRTGIGITEADFSWAETLLSESRGRINQNQTFARTTTKNQTFARTTTKAPNTTSRGAAEPPSVIAVSVLVTMFVVLTVGVGVGVAVGIWSRKCVTKEADNNTIVVPKQCRINNFLSGLLGPEMGLQLG